MGKTIDRTKEFYPDLEGAVLLEFVDDRIPEGYHICYSNVFSSADNTEGEWRPTVTDYEHWHWEGPPGFDGGYASAEQCLEHLLKYLKGEE